jgi:hypothetical protein
MTYGRDKEAFAEFAAKLGAELGMTVALREAGWGAWLGGADGEPGYWVNEPWNAGGKVEITGIYPDTQYHFPDGRPKIGATMARGAQAVAREIARRLEGPYLDTLARVATYNERQAREDYGREQTARAVEALFPEGMTHRVPHCQGNRRAEVSVGRYANGGDVEILNDGESVNLKGFRAPAPAVLAMLAAYAAWREANPEEEK